MIRKDRRASRLSIRGCNNWAGPSAGMCNEDVIGCGPRLEGTMRRREFFAIVGGAAVWPMAADAQQGERVRRVGVLMSYPDNDLDAQAWLATFHQGLQKLGWVEGRNIHSDSRWAGGEDTEALQKFARELGRGLINAQP